MRVRKLIAMAQRLVACLARRAHGVVITAPHPRLHRVVRCLQTFVDGAGRVARLRQPGPDPRHRLPTQGPRISPAPPLLISMPTRLLCCGEGSRLPALVRWPSSRLSSKLVLWHARGSRQLYSRPGSYILWVTMLVCADGSVSWIGAWIPRWPWCCSPRLSIRPSNLGCWSTQPTASRMWRWWATWCARWSLTGHVLQGCGAATGSAHAVIGTQHREGSWS